ERSAMHQGSDQKMAVVIGISVEQDDRMRPPPDHPIVPIFAFRKPATEETPGIGRVRPRGSADVRGTPGGPKPIHVPLALSQAVVFRRWLADRTTTRPPA